jgi:hypothetical protein
MAASLGLPAVPAGPTHTGSLPARADPAEGPGERPDTSACVPVAGPDPDATATLADPADGHTADGLGAAVIFGTATLRAATRCTGTAVPAAAAGACRTAATAPGAVPFTRPTASATTAMAGPGFVLIRRSRRQLLDIMCAGSRLS